MLYFDRAGNRCTAMTWTRIHGSARRAGRLLVAHDVLDYRWMRVRVSTTWLGLASELDEGPPKVFETLVIAPGTDLDELRFRYATEDEAREGHALICDAIREGRTPTAATVDPIDADEDETPDEYDDLAHPEDPDADEMGAL